MSIERGALVILALIAVVMGANWVSATTRFYDANQAYDRLTPTLEGFEFTGPNDPVFIDIGISNPSRTDVEVLWLRISLRAGLQSVGGGEVEVRQMLEAGGYEVFRVEAHITDRTYIERLEGEPINWLLSGQLQVRLDPDITATWINFRVRAESP